MIYLFFEFCESKIIYFLCKVIIVFVPTKTTFSNLLHVHPNEEVDGRSDHIKQINKSDVSIVLADTNQEKVGGKKNDPKDDIRNQISPHFLQKKGFDSPLWHSLQR